MPLIWKKKSINEVLVSLGIVGHLKSKNKNKLKLLENSIGDHPVASELGRISYKTQVGFCLVLLRPIRVWRDGPALGAPAASRGPGFSSRHQHQWFIACNSSSREIQCPLLPSGSSVLWGHAHTHDVDTLVHIPKRKINESIIRSVSLH